MTTESRLFSYEEALQTLPTVVDGTERAVRQIEALFNRLQSRAEMNRRRPELEAAVERVVQNWTSEMTALGCVVKGLWLVDWDSGDGYYCWRYPETSIAHFHGYEEGFAGRVPIN